MGEEAIVGASPDNDQLDTDGVVVDMETAGMAARANIVRRRAKVLAEEYESRYMELGKILYECSTPPPGGQALYKSWGFANFEAWVNTDLKLGLRSAQRMRSIWETMDQHLAGLDKTVYDRLVALGVTKLRTLAGVLKLDNAELWAERAERRTATELERDVSKARKEADIVYMNERCAEATQAVFDSEADAREQLLAQLASRSGQPSRPRSPQARTPVMADGPDALEGVGGLATVSDGAVEFTVVPLAETDKITTKTFRLHMPQRLTVQTALKRASEITGSVAENHLLEMICLDFIANNDVIPHENSQTRMRFLAKMERIFGLKLIALDAEHGEIAYGYRTLKELEGCDVPAAEGADSFVETDEDTPE